MKDIDYIKKFSKITITGICKKLKINRSALVSGRAKEDQEKQAREEIEHQIAQLYIKEE